MKAFVDKMLMIISIFCAALVVVFDICDEILGAAFIEKLFVKLHIPLSYDQAIIIMCVCVALMIITFILRKKLIRNL